MGRYDAILELLFRISSEIYFTEKKDKSMIRIFPQSQNPRIEQFLPTHFGFAVFPN